VTTISPRSHSRPARRRDAVVAVGCLAAAAAAMGAVAALGHVQPVAGATSIALRPLATDFNNPIDVEYHQPTGKLLLSVNYSSGKPNNFDLIAADGRHTPFSSVSGLTDEVYIASVRSSPCRGGFTIGQSFVGTGTPGAIARISPDGSRVDNPWVTLPGESGLLRGGIAQDRACVFGGDLIVTTTTGDVWRVSSAGVPRRLASHIAAPSSFEGPTTVPDDPRYGPWAGTVMLGNEGDKCVYSVTAAGRATCTRFGFDPESVRIIPPGENYFAVDFADHAVVTAPASEFAGMVGDILVANEGGVLQHVRYDRVAGRFTADQVAKIGQFEGSTFAPATVRLVAPTPGPTPPSSPPPVCALPVAGSCVLPPHLSTTTSSSASTGTVTSTSSTATGGTAGVLTTSTSSPAIPSPAISVPRTGEGGTRDTILLGLLLLAAAATLGAASAWRARARSDGAG
jgi:hypothetical protein